MIFGKASLHIPYLSPMYRYTNVPQQFTFYKIYETAIVQVVAATNKAYSSLEFDTIYIIYFSPHNLHDVHIN